MQILNLNALKKYVTFLKRKENGFFNIKPAFIYLKLFLKNKYSKL